MNKEHETSYSFDVIYFAKLVWKWKFAVAIVCILSGLLTYVFTGPSFVKPLYKANVIFYPTTNANLSTTLLTETGTQGYGLLEFGSDEDAEQLLQILKSDELKNNVIIKYHLAGHYGIDTTQVVSLLKMRTLFDKNYKAKLTEYKAIEVIVYDTDPKLAAEIANYIANYADFQKTAIQKVKAKEALRIIEAEYLSQKSLMDSVEELLSILRNNGIYDYFSQFEELNESLTTNSVRLEQEEALLKVYEENKSKLPDTLLIKTKARVEGYRAAVKSLAPTLEKLKKYGGAYVNHVNNQELERRKYLSLKTRYESAKMEFESALPQKFIINKADVPEIPSTPRRILTSAIVIASVFIFALLIIALIDAFPFIRRKLA